MIRYMKAVLIVGMVTDVVMVAMVTVDLMVTMVTIVVKVSMVTVTMMMRGGLSRCRSLRRFQQSIHQDSAWQHEIHDFTTRKRDRKVSGIMNL